MEHGTWDTGSELRFILPKDYITPNNMVINMKTDHTVTFRTVIPFQWNIRRRMPPDTRHKNESSFYFLSAESLIRRKRRIDGLYSQS